MLTVEFSQTHQRPYWHSPERGVFWETPTATADTAEAYGDAVDRDCARARFATHRRACNKWKQELHARFACGEVVDLACGRGGDLGKLPPVDHYWGLDGSPRALEEARRRNDETYRRDATFALVDFSRRPLDPTVLELLRRARCVSCMFALHYFPDLLQELDCALPLGAVVYGVAPYWPFVRRLLANPAALPKGFHISDGGGATYNFAMEGLVAGQEHRLHWPALEANLKRLRLVELTPLEAPGAVSMYAAFVLRRTCVHPLASIMPKEKKRPRNRDAAAGGDRRPRARRHEYPGHPDGVFKEPHEALERRRRD